MLAANPFLPVGDCFNCAEAADKFVREVYVFCNKTFFGGKLDLDGVTILPRCSASRELESGGGEAALHYQFAANCVSARLWIEISWSRARTWCLLRLSSVLLHELAHAWHDSVACPSPSQFRLPHSRCFVDFCKKAATLCNSQALPLFPNIFTESWILLTTTDLPVIAQHPNGPAWREWAVLLASAPAFTGVFVNDLRALGFSTAQIVAMRRRANDVNVMQALSLGYEGLHTWRRCVARVCMDRLAAGAPDVHVGQDYLVVALPQLQALAGAQDLLVCDFRGLFCVQRQPSCGHADKTLPQSSSA